VDELINAPGKELALPRNAMQNRTLLIKISTVNVGNSTTPPLDTGTA
jgi:hypothetical protein